MEPFFTITDRLEAYPTRNSTSSGECGYGQWQVENLPTRSMSNFAGCVVLVDHLENRGCLVCIDRIVSAENTCRINH